MFTLQHAWILGQAWEFIFVETVLLLLHLCIRVFGRSHARVDLPSYRLNAFTRYQVCCVLGEILSQKKRKEK